MNDTLWNTGISTFYVGYLVGQLPGNLWLAKADPRWLLPSMMMAWSIGTICMPAMTNGAGFIAIVLAMLSRGRPLWVLWGALLFGACLSMTTALQVAGIDVPTDVIQMLPFAMVMLTLVAFGRRAGVPAALGLPYLRGAR